MYCSSFVWSKETGESRVLGGIMKDKRIIDLLSRECGVKKHDVRDVRIVSGEINNRKIVEIGI